MNAKLWASYERGETSRDAVLLTRFGRVFSHFGIDAIPTYEIQKLTQLYEIVG